MILRTLWLSLIITISSLAVFVTILPASKAAAAALPFPQNETPQVAQNSTQKLRVRPSRVASRIGTAVQWRESLEQAIEESRVTGKPVFWYISTVPGTFTDRKAEIDRYLLAGPFSWPKIIDRLNESFIPVRVAPDNVSAEKLDLKPYKFVEPGYVILNAEQTVLARVDQMTTLHPEWLLQRIGSAVGPDEFKTDSIWQLPSDSIYLQVFNQFMEQPTKGEIPTAFQTLPAPSDNAPNPQANGAETLVQLWLMKGMLQYYAGQHEAARESWRLAVEAAPEHPLAWKAAAEREGFGPFVRGFERLGRIPEAAYNAGVESAGSAAPVGVYSEQELWRHSARFLMAMQREDGAILDSDYDFGGIDSLPNVHVAVTSLAGLALMQAQSRNPEHAEELEAAIQRAADFVRNESSINKADRDEILWAYAYRLRFLVARYRQQQEELATINRAVQLLEAVQGNRGSWYHEYSNSFVTATALIALSEAAQVGATVNQAVVDRGVQALLNDRFANGAFPYRTARGSNQDREGDLLGAAGRMPVCELALTLWQHSDQVRLGFAVEQSLLHHDKLRAGYKYDDHTSTLAYGGFFFWYDMRSRAEAIAHLQDITTRKTAIEQHRNLILGLPELDGCFVDSHELGRCYGTAMALLSLSWLDLAAATESSSESTR